VAYTDQILNLKTKVIAQIEGLPEQDLAKKNDSAAQIDLLRNIDAILGLGASAGATELTLAALNTKIPSSVGIKTAANSLSITPASDAFFPQGAIASTPVIYRTAITAADVDVPTVGTLTTASGGSLTAVAHFVRVVGVNAFGRSLPVIPASNGLTATASGVIRIPITVGNFTAFDIFMSSATDPLYLGRITAAQVTAGSLITAAATASANCSQSAGGTAGVVECRVLGTQRSASTESIGFSFIIPAAAAVNCAGRKNINLDIEATFTATPVTPSITVVPFFLNPLDSKYYQADTARTLFFNGFDSNQARIVYQVDGNTGFHLLVREFVGVGASFAIRSSTS